MLVAEIAWKKGNQKNWQRNSKPVILALHASWISARQELHKTIHKRKSTRVQSITMTEIKKHDLRKLTIIYRFLWQEAEYKYRILLILTLISVTIGSFGVIYAPYIFSKIIDDLSANSLYKWSIILLVAAYCLLYWISNSLYQAVWVIFSCAVH